ncbi:hypothetical protein TNIN_74131 [Trichonephila inaurata madagascariensis]|uniref:Uncharacterized protein n=1 Tax=Trichonephila inaurata madagascariensis TaxID=2747483 RepID=A0A8X6YML5_9ARAC|nr:hypothetical protein TNIN_74131 [Trichonephila inaurata madagascariensis]
MRKKRYEYGLSVSWEGWEEEAGFQSRFQSFKERVIGRCFDERGKGTCVASSFSAGEVPWVGMRVFFNVSCHRVSTGISAMWGDARSHLDGGIGVSYDLVMEIGLESLSNVFWGGGFGDNSSVVSEKADFNQWRGGEVMREDVIEYRTEVGPLRRARLDFYSI